MWSMSQGIITQIKCELFEVHELLHVFSDALQLVSIEKSTPF